tara:strand:+ start:674 stop:1162 length:489 start_codon:yes stop_codon:yes gene_type:complete
MNSLLQSIFIIGLVLLYFIVMLVNSFAFNILGLIVSLIVWFYSIISFLILALDKTIGGYSRVPDENDSRRKYFKRNLRMTLLFGILISFSLIIYCAFRIVNIENNYIANITSFWLFSLSIFSTFSYGPMIIDDNRINVGILNRSSSDTILNSITTNPMNPNS